MTPDALRKLAEAATPGPWTEHGRDIDHDRFVAEGKNPGDACGLGCEIEGPEEAWLRGQFQRHADAALIAALDPQTVLRLLDVVEAARIARDLLGNRTPGTIATADGLLRAVLASLDEQ